MSNCFFFQFKIQIKTHAMNLVLDANVFISDKLASNKHKNIAFDIKTFTFVIVNHILNELEFSNSIAKNAMIFLFSFIV